MSTVSPVLHPQILLERLDHFLIIHLARVQDGIQMRKSVRHARNADQLDRRAGSLHLRGIHLPFIAQRIQLGREDQGWSQVREIRRQIGRYLPVLWQLAENFDKTFCH